MRTRGTRNEESAFILIIGTSTMDGVFVLTTITMYSVIHEPLE